MQCTVVGFFVRIFTRCLGKLKKWLWVIPHSYDCFWNCVVTMPKNHATESPFPISSHDCWKLNQKYILHVFLLLIEILGPSKSLMPSPFQICAAACTSLIHMCIYMHTCTCAYYPKLVQRGLFWLLLNGMCY